MLCRVKAIRALPHLLLPMACASPAAAQGLAQREWAVTATAILAAAWLAFAVWSVIRSARTRVQAEMAQSWGLRLRGLLTTTPGAYLVVHGDGRASCSDLLRSWLSIDRKVQRLDDLAPQAAAGLSAPDYALLTDRIEALALSGKAFSSEMTSADGTRRFAVEGRQAPPQLAGDNGVVVWFGEMTAAAERIAALEHERDAVSRMLAGASAMVDASPFPMWRRNAEQKLIQVNKAYADAVEADSTATVVRLGVELFANPLGPTPQAAARAALDSGRAHVREEAAIIGGARRMMRVIDLPVGGGEVAGYAIDISERDEAVGELERFVAAQTATLDRLSAGVARFAPDRCLVFWNRAFAALFRLDAHFLDERPEFDRLFERMREARRLPEQRDFPSWRRERRAWFTAALDGSDETWVLPDNTVLRVLAQPNPDGGLLLIFEDRSEQLRLASSRDTLQRVQEATLENLHEAVAVFSADGRIQLFNRNFAAGWHLDEGHLAAKPHVDDLVPADAVPDSAHDRIGLLRDLIQASAAGRQSRTGKIAFDDSRVLQYAAVPLPDGNALFTFIDITDSTRIENALRERNEALEAADRQKTAFVENMSYELRTPLTAISGFAEMLAGGYAGPLDDRQADYVRSIIVSAERLQLLINDLLDLAVSESGTLVLDRNRVEISRLVDGVAAMIEGSASDRAHELVIAVDDSAGTIDGDATRLKQALYNLAKNAVRFTPEGGRVSIVANGDDQHVRIRVTDTGIGIPADEQTQVFERFRKGSNVKSGQGVGLGLSLVRDVVELHGGSTELTSAIGEGTTVTIRLPRTTAKTSS